MNFDLEMLASGPQHPGIMPTRCAAPRRCLHPLASAAVDQVQDRLVRKRRPAPTARSRRCGWSNSRRALRGQRCLQVTQRVFVQLGADETAVAGEAAALHLVGASPPGRCSGPAIAISLSTVPILRTLHTGCSATGCGCGSIVTRGSTASCTNSMLSCSGSRPGQVALHAVGAGAGVEHDGPASALAGVAQRGFELGRLEVRRVHQALALERLAAAQPAEPPG